MPLINLIFTSLDIAFLYDSLGITSLVGAVLLTAETYGDAIEDTAAATELEPDKLKVRLFRSIKNFNDHFFNLNSSSRVYFKKIAKISFWSAAVLYTITFLYKKPDFSQVNFQDYFIFGFTFAGTVLASIVFDIFAVYKSKFLFNYLTKGHRQKKLLRVLLLDFFAAFVIGFFKCWLLFEVFTARSFFGGIQDFFINILGMNYRISGFYIPSVPGVFFYTTFVSSFFIWVYALAVFLLQTTWIDRFFIKIHVDPKKKPIKALKILFVVALVAIWLFVNICFAYIFPIIIHFIKATIGFIQSLFGEHAH